MDWRRLVRTSWMRLTSSLVGAPVIDEKLAVPSEKRYLASSTVVMMSDGRRMEAGNICWRDGWSGDHAGGSMRRMENQELK